VRIINCYRKAVGGIANTYLCNIELTLKQNKMKTKLLFAFLFSLCILLRTVSTAQVIAAGAAHSIFLCLDSTVWSCGFNASGQLGVGDTIDRSTPIAISGLAGSGVISIAGGNRHSLFVKNDGTVWASGFNNYGQLGDGTTIDRWIPVQVSGLTGITGASGEAYRSVFLKNDSTIWICGSGIGTAPVQMAGISSVIAIASGIGHSLFVKSDGTAWARGANAYGQLGNGTTTGSTTPVQVTGLSGIISVAAGDEVSYFLRNDGTVWACGRNDFGQLGNDGNFTFSPTPIPVQVLNVTGITKISAGYYHALFLKNDGTVWACGKGASGQLGNGLGFNLDTAILINTLMPNCNQVVGGGSYSFFTITNATVWACGTNLNGQYGNGTLISSYSPLQVTGLCQIMTGVEKGNFVSSINLFPNPTTNHFTIVLASSNKIVEVNIYDIAGKIIYKTTAIEKQKIEVNTKDFEEGFYVVQIQAADFIETKKLIVVK